MHRARYDCYYQIIDDASAMIPADIREGIRVRYYRPATASRYIICSAWKTEPNDRY